VQDSSAKLLNFYVEDLLCIAQIEKGTFRKNISRFDVREAIEEVISI
jgi:K+-sensing histidine kinase KdpD